MCPDVFDPTTDGFTYYDLWQAEKAKREEMQAALEAHAAWADAEHESPKMSTTFHERMDLCSYSEWLTDKALGRPHDENWHGVPRLILDFNYGERES